MFPAKHGHVREVRVPPMIFLVRRERHFFNVYPTGNDRVWVIGIMVFKDRFMQHPLHNQEKEQFKKLFQQDHVDRFEDRFNVLKVFLENEDHLKAEELTTLLAQEGHQLDLEFVRETLKLMCQYGFAQKNQFDNGVVRYEHLHLGQHHDHLICTKCRKIIEFSDEQLEDLQVQIAATHGFHLLQHKMELYGICQTCLNKRVEHLPLIMTKQGEKVVIKAINGGTSIRIRLLTMGLRIGDEIEILTKNHGQMVIASDYKRLVIGKGISRKIIVEPINSKARNQIDS
jgi:Fur family ferric uptake transcriptional regulator